MARAKLEAAEVDSAETQEALVSALHLRGMRPLESLVIDMPPHTVQDEAGAARKEAESRLKAALVVLSQAEALAKSKFN